MKISSLPWVLIPGLGQIHQGRVLLGIFLFVLFASGVNLFFTGPLLFPSPPLRTWSGIGAIAVWVLSAAEFIWRTVKGASGGEDAGP